MNGVAKYSLGARCRLLPGPKKQQAWLSTAVGPNLDESVHLAFVDRSAEIPATDAYGEPTEMRGVSVAGKTSDVL
jgi:hypothetical protein